MRTQGFDCRTRARSRVWRKLTPLLPRLFAERGRAPTGEHEGTSDHVARALAFLYSKQRADGGWGESGGRVAGARLALSPCPTWGARAGTTRPLPTFHFCLNVCPRRWLTAYAREDALSAHTAFTASVAPSPCAAGRAHGVGDARHPRRHRGRRRLAGTRARNAPAMP
eukprot:2298512-Pleurochrysis_carterae.AAC.1